MVSLLALNGCSPGGPSALSAEVETGLDERPANPTCHPPPSPLGAVRWAEPFPNLPRTLEPVALRHLPGNHDSWFVVERQGRVYQFENRPEAASLELVLDIKDRVAVVENGGLLGFAFHPQFLVRDDKRFVYVFYTAPGDPAVSRLSRFTWPGGADELDPGSEQILISVPQIDDVHMSDDLHFGPDGYLYASLGDGGPQADPENHSQDPFELRGKMWRIDVDNGDPYAIPDGNPFKDGGGRPEIYALGLRNPFRFSFDSQTGAIYLGDVGSDNFEEINRIELGRNYGWSCFEGPAATGWAGERACLGDPVPPLHSYGHDGASASVTGGRVYHGNQIPALQGRYVFADFITTAVRAVDVDTGEATDLGPSGFSITDFAEDRDGEILVTDIQGFVRKLVRGSDDEPPARLSETGCFEPANPSQPVPALIPFDVRAPLWSDGAVKRRWMALPDGAAIHVEAGGERPDDFSFPPGSVLIKEFARPDGARMETRFFVRHGDGQWSGYTYQWRGDQSDAELLPSSQESHTATWGDQVWDYPTRAQCFACHTGAAGRALGPEIAQLNSSIDYPATGRNANQLATLSAIGAFDEPLALPPDQLPALATLDGPEPAEARVRSLLHANCGGCHRPGGPGRGPADLRHWRTLAETNLCDVPPALDPLGIEDARLVAPGAPERSVVLARMSRREPGQMPPLATRVVDGAGIDLVRSWIADMPGCPQSF